MRWTGRGFSALCVVVFAFSAAVKFFGTTEMKEFTDTLGYPQSTIVPIGMIELACVILYAIPQTAGLGAILLTGYLGGAVATHVRVEDGQFFGPVLAGVLVWLGLYLRDARLRSLVPWRRRPV
jgi:hypothetical protein